MKAGGEQRPLTAEERTERDQKRAAELREVMRKIAKRNGAMMLPRATNTKRKRFISICPVSPINSALETLLVVTAAHVRLARCVSPS